MRGARKCGTCVCFDPLPAAYKGDGCKLPVCECRSQDKRFGIALCPNYVSQKFLDTSNSRTGGSPVDGFCRWEPPPALRSMLWGQGGHNRQVNSETSWCHCWTPIKDAFNLDLGAGTDAGVKLIEGK